MKNVQLNESDDEQEKTRLRFVRVCSLKNVNLSTLFKSCLIKILPRATCRHWRATWLETMRSYLSKMDQKLHNLPDDEDNVLYSRSDGRHGTYLPNPAECLKLNAFTSLIDWVESNGILRRAWFFSFLSFFSPHQGLARSTHTHTNRRENIYKRRLEK